MIKKFQMYRASDNATSKCIRGLDMYREWVTIDFEGKCTRQEVWVGDSEGGLERLGKTKALSEEVVLQRQQWRCLCSS